MLKLFGVMRQGRSVPAHAPSRGTLRLQRPLRGGGPALPSCGRVPVAPASGVQPPRLGGSVRCVCSGLPLGRKGYLLHYLCDRSVWSASCSLCHMVVPALSVDDRATPTRGHLCAAALIIVSVVRIITSERSTACEHKYITRKGVQNPPRGDIVGRSCGSVGPCHCCTWINLLSHPSSLLKAGGGSLFWCASSPFVKPTAPAEPLRGNA